VLSDHVGRRSETRDSIRLRAWWLAQEAFFHLGVIVAQMALNAPAFAHAGTTTIRERVTGIARRESAPCRASRVTSFATEDVSGSSAIPLLDRHPCGDLRQVHSDTTLIGSSAHVDGRAVGGVAQPSLNLGLRVLADGTYV
jgi:hypothetical protein